MCRRSAHSAATGSTTAATCRAACGSAPMPTRSARPVPRRATARLRTTGRGPSGVKIARTSTNAWSSERERQQPWSRPRRAAGRCRRARPAAQAATAYRAATAKCSKIIRLWSRHAMPQSGTLSRGPKAVYTMRAAAMTGAQTSPGSRCSTISPTPLARRQDAARRSAPHRSQHPGRAARSAARAARSRRRAAGREGFHRGGREKALGDEVVGSLTPGQALVGVVQRELAALMGGAAAPLDFATQPPAVILLAGLQGAGKTTTAAKLARLIREEQQEEGAARVGRRLPAGGDRAAEDARGAGRRRFLPVVARPEAGRDRARRRSTGRAAITTTC